MMYNVLDETQLADCITKSGLHIINGYWSPIADALFEHYPNVDCSPYYIGRLDEYLGASYGKKSVVVCMTNQAPTNKLLYAATTVATISQDSDRYLVTYAKSRRGKGTPEVIAKFGVNTIRQDYFI